MKKLTNLKNIIEYIKKVCYSKIKERWYLMKGYKAIDFANWFLWYNELQQKQSTDDDYDVYEGLTHLKIQKLLYFADGICLAVTGSPLFKEKIYAWPHGPVVKEVYKILSINGKKDIEFNKNEWEKIKKINEDSELFDVLVTTYDSYAGYTAWQLREKSHVPGGPWQMTVDKKGMQKEIEPKLIKEYFSKNIVQVND